jgi:hypothetical protein
VEKHELSKVEFEIIDKALKGLLQSNLDPATSDKVNDLRNMFPGRLHRLARNLPRGRLTVPGR